jgi:hypothetical protein
LPKNNLSSLDTKNIYIGGSIKYDMKKRLAIFGIILSLFLIANVSAVVHFSRLSSVYNVGDIIEIELTIDPIENAALKTELVCDNVAEMIDYKSIVQESKVSFKLPFRSSQVGECHLEAESSGEVYESQTFEISKLLDVRLDTGYFSVKPGESITIKGTASKLNGNPINGTVKVSVPPLAESVDDEEEDEEEEDENDEDSEDNEDEEEEEEEDEEDSEDEDENEEEEEDSQDEEDNDRTAGVFYSNVVDGKFTVNFTLSEEIASGNYRVTVLVEEEAENNRDYSEGKTEATLNIQQVLTETEVALNDQNIDPGTVLSFIPLLKDQAGRTVSEEDVAVIIRDSQGNRIFEKIVESDKKINYDIPTDTPADYYEIEVSYEDITSVKKFFINEKAQVSFELQNETVVVTNIGNVPYNKDVQIEINGKPFIKKIELDLKESQEFRLTAPPGEYDIKITDGESEIAASGVALTGHAIDVETLKKTGRTISTSPIVWIFVILVLGAGVFFFFRNMIKKASVAYPLKEKLKLGIRKPKIVSLVNDKKNTLSATNISAKEKKNAPGALTPPNQAEQVLVLKGQKNPAVMIAIKIKNKISEAAKKSLERAIEPVYEKRGAVYEQGDYILIILSPLMTRSFKNEVEAAKIAEKIILGLKEHNKKFKDKIEFGLGISTGNVINKIEDKKFKFTALGNFITSAKRLAESSNEQIFVTKEAYEKGISSLHGEKRSIGGGEIYEIRKIVDREANAKFIQGFLKRMDK